MRSARIMRAPTDGARPHGCSKRNGRRCGAPLWRWKSVRWRSEFCSKQTGRWVSHTYTMASCDRFVRRVAILSGGTINTPQLLMLSGMGPAEHLRALGSPVRLDAPLVRGNLQDHLDFGMSYGLDAQVSHAWMGSLPGKRGSGVNGCRRRAVRGRPASGRWEALHGASPRPGCPRCNITSARPSFFSLGEALLLCAAEDISALFQHVERGEFSLRGLGSSGLFGAGARPREWLRTCIENPSSLRDPTCYVLPEVRAQGSDFGQDIP